MDGILMTITFIFIFAFLGAYSMLNNKKSVFNNLLESFFYSIIIFSAILVILIFN